VNKELLVGLLSYLFLLVTAVCFSLGMGWGAAESGRELSSWWYYLRRLLLIAASLNALRGSQQASFLAELGWKVPVRWIVFAIPVGIGMGCFNRGGFDPRVPETLPLALFHTFSMELYFRAYLFRMLERTAKSWPTALIGSSLLYALYYQTMWTVWIQPPANKVVMFVMFTGLGMLFSYSYKKSGSFLVNWTMHIFTGLNYRLLFP
jgi:membrane protease YdiL (CAAX protease family)